LVPQLIGAKSQDGGGSPFIKNHFVSALPLAEPLVNHDGGYAAFFELPAMTPSGHDGADHLRGRMGVPMAWILCSQPAMPGEPKDTIMKKFFIGLAFVLTFGGSALANYLNETCAWQQRGIVAAASCLANVYRSDASVRRFQPNVAQMDYHIALKIETIADLRRAGQITEEQAIDQFTAAVDHFNANFDRVAAEDTRRAVYLLGAMRPPSVICALGTCF
jgi:hypothetical protein